VMTTSIITTMQAETAMYAWTYAVELERPATRAWSSEAANGISNTAIPDRQGLPWSSAPSGEGQDAWRRRGKYLYLAPISMSSLSAMMWPFRIARMGGSPI
jgi:hypothetical protein